MMASVLLLSSFVPVLLLLFKAENNVFLFIYLVHKIFLFFLGKIKNFCKKENICYLCEFEGCCLGKHLYGT
jgi:hypothetical protein